jgi:hypothetical protein
VNEIASLNAAGAAIQWAGRSLGAKNALTAEDASAIEAAFRDRMQVLQPEIYSPSEAPVDPPTRSAETALQPRSAGSTGDTAASEARPLQNKTPRPRKIQSSTIRSEGPDDLISVKLRRSREQPRALGRRVSDEFTVPLCRVHHRELHRQGDERVWWNKANIDPTPIALRFWQHTRGMLPVASLMTK